MTAILQLMKSVLTSLAKNGLLPLGLSVGMSAIYGAIQRKIQRLTTTALKKRKNGKCGNIVKWLEQWGFSIKGISETIKNIIKK